MSLGKKALFDSWFRQLLSGAAYRLQPLFSLHLKDLNYQEHQGISQSV
jgi:hypothetical protein